MRVTVRVAAPEDDEPKEGEAEATRVMVWVMVRAFMMEEGGGCVRRRECERERGCGMWL